MCTALLHVVRLQFTSSDIHLYAMATHIIVGLGNPDPEHEQTRHNTGRMVVERIHATHDFSEWKAEKKPPMVVARGSIAGKKAILVAPNTYMNNSGRAVAHSVKSKKDAGNTIVIYDDMDLPLGTLKISHGRSSGGHNGVESVIRALKTRDFVRVRVGVSPATAKGAAKKPSGEERVLKFLLGKFTPAENAELKKIFKRAIEAVELIVTEGYQNAMTHVN
jgi:peptidyl-tRNA hydrolase, PTH1 family